MKQSSIILIFILIIAMCFSSFALTSCGDDDEDGWVKGDYGCYTGVIVIPYGNLNNYYDYHHNEPILMKIIEVPALNTLEIGTVIAFDRDNLNGKQFIKGDIIDFHIFKYVKIKSIDQRALNYYTAEYSAIIEPCK